MYKTTLQLILIGILIMLFNSCQTAKQLMDKAEKKNPAIVAEYARDKYPCTDLLKPDTAILYRDTTVYIDCPDSIPATFETVRVDTVNNTVVKTVRVPVTLPIRTQIITKYYEDSAKLKLAGLQIQELQADTTRLQASNKILSGRLATRTKIMWWLIALCIGLTVWNFRKLILKLFI